MISTTGAFSLQTGTKKILHCCLPWVAAEPSVLMATGNTEHWPAPLGIPLIAFGDKRQLLWKIMRRLVRLASLAKNPSRGLTKTEN